MKKLNLKECLALDAEHAQRVKTEIYARTPIRRIWAHAGGPLILFILGALLLNNFVERSDKSLPQLPPDSVPARVW
jgi:hypothetical protein